VHAFEGTRALPLCMQSMSSNSIIEFGDTWLIAFIKLRSLKTARLIA
jgi:hypothetical protein